MEEEMEIVNREEIVVGTYEEFLLGYRVQKDEDGKTYFKQSFANHSHNGRLKQIAISGKTLVSSATDEYLRIFDLNRRKEVGDIFPPTGTISVLKFHKDKFMFACSEEGKILVYEKNTWKLLSKLKGHTGAVVGLSIHPSGKMAISIGQNKQMITWNLLTGEMACKSSLKKVPVCIEWSLDGTHYAIASGNYLDIFNVESGRNIDSVDFQQEIHTVVFLNKDIMAVGCEEGTITLYSIEEKTDLLQWIAHSKRVKQLSVYSKQNPDAVVLVSVSSGDGFLKMWMISTVVCSKEPVLVAEVFTNSRITCMGVRPDFRPIKRKLEEIEIKEEPIQEDEGTDNGEDIEIIKPKSIQLSRPKRKRGQNHKPKTVGEGILKSSEMEEEEEKTQPQPLTQEQENKKLAKAKKKQRQRRLRKKNARNNKG